MHFTWLTPPGPYGATTCWERELTLYHIILFWSHKNMEGYLGWGISSMPGPLPRQHEHERRYTPFTHSFVLTGWMWMDDYDGQMIFGELEGLKLPDIYLTGEENPKKKKKNSARKRIPTRIEPGPAAWQARMLQPASQRWAIIIIIIVISILYLM